METTSSIDKRCLRNFTRRASLVAIGLTAATLVTARPVFAQTYGGDTPEMSIEQYGSPVASNPIDPWNAVPPPLTDPDLAPAPKEPAEPQLPEMNETFTPRPESRYIEPWNDPATPFIQPMAASPSSPMGVPRGGLPYPLR
jgi:hypothetical protein